MGGFKDGSTDLYSDDEDSPAVDDSDSDPQTSSSESMSETESEADESTETAATQELPYIAERRMKGAGTQYKRPNRLTLFVQDHVEAGERELKNDVEEIVGREVSKFDLREAAYEYAQKNPGAVAALLESKGLNYEP